MDYEFYPTPPAFTRWLFAEVPMGGQMADVCVGDEAIVEKPLSAAFVTDLGQ